ncbi:MAG: hypothetical protein IT429_00195 [Gemmataceae bacterium]|nr:hypothetical protein [Gemmataceae bacterium]
MKKTTLALAAVAFLALTGMVNADRQGGPGVWSGRVSAYSSRYLTEYFVGGRTAVVSIVGDGSTDVDIIVRDENGNVVARGLGPTDRETVRFRPIWTGRFTIELRNLGSVWNRVSLATN